MPANARSIVLPTRLSRPQDAALQRWAPSVGLPAPPAAPVPGECCGRGCEPCVWDFHARAVARWAERHDVTDALTTVIARAITPVPSAAVTTHS